MSRKSKRWFNKNHEPVLEVSWGKPWFWVRLEHGNEDTSSRLCFSMWCFVGFWLYLPWPRKFTYTPRTLFELQFHWPDAALDPYLSLELGAPVHSWSKSEPWWMRWKLSPIKWILGKRVRDTVDGPKRHLKVRTADGVDVSASANEYTVTHTRSRWPGVWRQWTNYQIRLEQGVGPRGTTSSSGPAADLDSFLAEFEERCDVVIREETP